MNTILHGYDNFRDSETGDVLTVERSTGEVLKTVNVDIPIGSIYYTPEQQKAYKKRKERERKNEQIRRVNSPLGKFFFVPSDEQFKGIAPETVTRLIYLSTFMDYENNRLMVSKRISMKRKDLVTVLNVSKATVSRFWKEISPTYIVESANGLLFTNKDVFKRGRIQNRKFLQYQKFYINGVRKLYEATETKNHKRLGCLFKLLPFINIEFNLLCYPKYIMETDLEKIELISIYEFCRWIDFDVKHLNDLVSAYRNICFDVNGRCERFCVLSYDGVNKRNAKICINPHILYNGSDYTKVEVLGAFCRA